MSIKIELAELCWHPIVHAGRAKLVLRYKSLSVSVGIRDERTPPRATGARAVYEALYYIFPGDIYGPSVF